VASGDVTGAQQTLRDVSSGGEEEMRPALTATRGLIRFRSGEPSAGRKLYQQAIAMMTSRDHQLRAELMLAFEEMRSGAIEGRQHAVEVLDAIARASNRQLKIWARYVTDETQAPGLEKGS
jgi:hypothetical protein